MARSAQTLSVEDRRLVAAWAADCVERVRPLFEAAAPGDDRVRDAIGLTRAFASGDVAVGDALRRRGGDAGGAARDAPTTAARAAAYAAEQAAAVAHMGAHALGAAGYAVAAVVRATPDEPDAAVETEVAAQLALMSTKAATALARLPELGTDRSGPLAPGRLSRGHIGEAIRLIQAALSAPGRG